jgi:type I restriction enzyme, S subunit
MEMTKENDSANRPNWEQLLFGDVVKKILGGGTPPRAVPAYWNGNIPWATVKDYASFTGTDTQERITELGLKNSASNLIPSGTLITSTRMALGKAVIYNVPVSINQDLKAIFPNERITTAYLYHWFESKRDYIVQRGSGSTVLGMTLDDLKKIPIEFPRDKSEQTAIATALSDADALITSLEKLIDKKRNIKQGAMQELLKPKRGACWTTNKIGKLADCFSGGTPLTSVPSFYGGNISWITSSDLNKHFIFEVNGKITKEGLLNSSAKMIPPETVLVALYGATAGVCALSKITAAINQAILALIPHAQLNHLFLYYKLSLLKDWIITTYTQGGQPNLSGDIIKCIELSYPSLEEQEMTARVLQEMDTELVLLEKTLLKLRNIKLSMMQSLLTGKIRLV